MTVTHPQQVNGSQKMKIDALTISFFQCKYESKNIQRVLELAFNKTRINIMGISLKIASHRHFYAGAISDV